MNEPMQEMNIVTAQNKVLSEAFGVDCYLLKFICNVEMGDYEINIGKFHSKIVFRSKEQINIEVCKGLRLVDGEVIDTFYGKIYEYDGLFVKGSEIRKNLLLAMLEHN